MSNIPDTAADDEAETKARATLVADALEIFQRRGGYQKPVIVEILEEFGGILLEAEEARRKAVSAELLARAETAYEAVHGDAVVSNGPGGAYFRKLRAKQTLDAVGKEMRSFMSSKVPSWFSRRRPGTGSPTNAEVAAREIADAWFPKGHHDNVLLAEDVASAIARFDSTGGVAASPMVVESLKAIKEASALDGGVMEASATIVSRLADIHQHSSSLLAVLTPEKTSTVVGDEAWS